MANGRCHSSRLPVAAFDERDLKPRSRNVFAKANGWIARWQCRFVFKHSDLCWPSAITLDLDARGQSPQAGVFRNALNLNQVGSLVSELWVGEPVLEFSVVSQEEKAFAVLVQPSRSVDTGNWNVLFQRAAFAGKLAEHSEWLVENDVTIRQIPDYRNSTWDESTVWARVPAKEQPDETCACIVPDLRLHRAHNFGGRAG